MYKICSMNMSNEHQKSLSITFDSERKCKLQEKIGKCKTYTGSLQV